MTEISLPAHVLFSIGPVPITDAFLGAVIVTVGILTFFFLATRKFRLIPTRIQLLMEIIIEYILDQLENAFGSRKQAESFLPFFVTLVLFVAAANQIALMPFIFEITYEGKDVFRQSTSDLSQPLALAIMIFGIANILALKISPIKHLSNFINIKPLLMARTPGAVFNGLIEVFIGVLNIIGEIAKVISLSCRLFGNIFAGNVMVAVIMSLAAFTQFLIPIPFLILSVFSGFVQAFVFMILGIQFTALTIQGAQPAPKEAEVTT